MMNFLTNRNRLLNYHAVRPGGNPVTALLSLFVALSLLVGNPAQASDHGDNAEDLIRSAMVFNFCKFVQWPETDLDTLVLGVMVDPGENPDFSSIQGKAVNQSHITVRQIESPDDLAGCQVVFIPKGHKDKLQGAFAAAQAESILTISEIDGFCSQGGMIQLVERRGKMRFFINKEAAGDSQLRLSSQLLKMAKLVEGG